MPSPGARWTMTAKGGRDVLVRIALATVLIVAAAVEFALEFGMARRAVSPVWVRARIHRR